MGQILPAAFYQQEDVLYISQQLLGKFLFTRIGEQFTGGMIVETEAYRAPEDRASHAYGMRRTKRNEVMFGKSGHAYVYLCYGIHSLFNVTTNQEGIPHAILIRAIEPSVGVEIMLKRRNKATPERSLTAGPGALAQALGITLNHNGISLLEDTIWLEDRNITVKPAEITATPRVGVAYAGEDALLPWRFRIAHHPWTSRVK
jgi:DNA-3-methyladenine glycosylase